MTFLWPAAAWLALLALPVILFYLIRQKLRARAVTTLLFWESLAPKVHNLPLWRRLRRLISLLLQLLLLALIILALGRPTSTGSTAASSTVLILDPGVTMTAKLGQGTRWQAALDLVRRRIDAMSFGDQATLLLAGDPPRVLSPWTSHRADLRDALAAIQPAATVTDIRSTLDLAQNLVLSHPGASIDLISDTVWPIASTAHIRLDRIGQGEPNSGITLFSARELSSGAGEYQLALELQQNTSAPVSGAVEITRNGQLMDEVEATILPGTPWRKMWRGQSTAACDFAAKWTPRSPDNFAADQQAQTSLPAVRTVQVALVSPPNSFLEVAFASQALVEAHRIWPAAGTHADLTVFNHAVPSGPLPPNAVLINPSGSGEWGKRNGPIEKPLVSDMDKDAPILRFLDLTPVELHAATSFTPPPGAHVYAASFGQPLIYGHWESEPRWLVLAFDLDRSDLVLRTAFPILCANLVEPLRAQDTARADNVPGPVATQLKPLASASTAGTAAPPPRRFGWLQAIPLWWWAACDAFLLLLVEWSLYTRRITE